jgi:hypothetical protein
MSQPILIKLRKERDDLNDRLTDLNTYVASGDHVALPDRQKAYIQRQLRALQTYKHTVLRRIEYYESLPA